MTPPLSTVPRPPAVKPAVLGEKPSGFFDPNDPSAPPEILLSRIVSDLGVEEFRLLRPIGYWDSHVGGLVVPHDLEAFDTDFTSVPMLFTWLIPKSGQHLPAALLHDGLVRKSDDATATYLTLGDSVGREDADRVFRDALRDLGVSGVRRWLMWTGASLGTLRHSPSRWLRYLVVGWIIAISLIGIAATIDLLPARELLPWIVGPIWLEVVTGAAGAILIPTVLGRLLWGARWRVGAISGIALALLVHVTIALVVVSNVFLSTEAAFDKRPHDAFRHAAIAVGVVAACALAAWLAAVVAWTPR